MLQGYRRDPSIVNRRRLLTGLVLTSLLTFVAFRFGIIGGDEEAVCDVLARSFAIAPAEIPTWLDQARRENVRVLRERGNVVGCNMLIPMGQYFGGRSVPTTGIAAVGVAPEHRGRGAALALMLSTVRELADGGVALSTLYPAMLTLYRRVGYEVAGGRYETIVPNAALELDLTMERGRKRGSKRARSGDPATTMRSFEAKDRPAIRRLYRSIMRHETGALDRGEYVWKRVEQPRGLIPYGYVVHHDDTLEGYAFLVHEPTSRGEFNLRFTDFIAETPRAIAKLWQLLVTHRSRSPNTYFYGSPHPAPMLRLAEHYTKVRLDHPWQIRIVSVKQALECRGYAPGLRAEVHLDVVDEHLSQNHGRFVFDLADGLAHVRKGGKGRVRLHVRSLATLFAGYHSAHQLRRLGRLEASDRDVALLSAAFAGPPPTMGDMF